MAYCTITDVNALTPQAPFTATTTPTQAQVEVFIVDTSTILDACLRNLGYVTPVDTVASPLSKIILTRMTSAGALGLALQVRLTAVAPDASIQNNVWTQRFEKWLTALKSNTDPFELPDAGRTGSAVVKPLGELARDTTSITDGSYTYATNPPFSMNMKL